MVGGRGVGGEEEKVVKNHISMAIIMPQTKVDIFPGMISVLSSTSSMDSKPE